MKRQKKKRRLEVAKTTIRTLQGPDLAPVKGGNVPLGGYGFTCNKNNCGTLG